MLTEAHPMNDPAHLRKRAGELRKLALEMVHSGGQQLMLKLAEEYELLAKRAEERSAAKIGRG
jgi:hypothetical protein